MEKIINPKVIEVEKEKITMSEDNNVNLPPPPAPETPKRKRNIQFIGLAVICIVLAASLIAVFAVYQPTSLQGQVNNKNKEISSLQTQISSLKSQFNSNATGYENQIQSLNSELTNLTNEVNSANGQLENASNIMTMKASTTLLNAAAETIPNSSYVDVFDNSLPYPGYVAMQETSNSTTTYVQVIYSVYGVNYNENVTLGKSGTADFPVLPTTVDIRIGNEDKIASNATVTVTYTY